MDLSEGVEPICLLILFLWFIEYLFRFVALVNAYFSGSLSWKFSIIRGSFLRKSDRDRI